MKFNIDLSNSELTNFFVTFKQSAQTEAELRQSLLTSNEKLRDSQSKAAMAERSLNYVTSERDSWKREYDHTQNALVQERELARAGDFDWTECSVADMETALLNLAAFLNNPKNKPALQLMVSAAKGKTVDVIKTVRNVTHCDLREAKNLVEKCLAAPAQAV